LIGRYVVAGTPASDGPYYEVFFNASDGFVGGIYESGTTGIGISYSSDRRLKENIVDSDAGLSMLMKLKVRDYDFVSDSKHERQQGFVAQEIYKIYPQVVNHPDDGIKPLAKGAIPWGVDYGRLTPLIVKSVQDLKALFDGEAGDINKLKADNDNLRARLDSDEREIGDLKRAIGAH
jgi:Chaperone of endosialidase